MEHPNIVEFLVYGDYALFSDPITRVGGEKSTYQIPTYEALKGVLSSVYWKPTIIWYIDKVRVMNQIMMESKGIRPIKMNKGNDLSYYTYLKKCAYQVQAHFEWNEKRPELAEDRNENKHHNIAKRMIEKGGRRYIFLKGFYDNVPRLDFGLMYHGITYADEAYSQETRDKMTVRFWYPKMEFGVVTFQRPQDIPMEMCKVTHEMKIKPFGESSYNFSGLREFGEVN